MVNRENFFPLVIVKSQDIKGLCWTTSKTAEKILEQGRLWIIHPETKKEVLYSPEIFVSNVYDKDKWFLVELDEAYDVEEDAWNGLEKLSFDNFINKEKEIQVRLQMEDIVYKDLIVLENIIENRKKNMTEGSYTTHLFTQGTNKIKKKLGEETVEVLLSQSSEELIHESADLMYHLFVLLMEQEVSPQEVVQELIRRHIKEH